MNAQNLDLWPSFLEEVTGSESKHYLWLRSLSYLEYIGYRKMVKALDYDKVNKGVYHHLTDEIQHSYMLRELAEKSYGRGHGDSFTEEFQKIAEEYFQKIDGAIDAWVQGACGGENSHLCYLLTSYIVEKRAMQVYPHYYNRLAEAPSKYIIQKIIKDESEHLSYLEGKMSLVPGLDALQTRKLLDFESECFGAYLRQMRACFQGARAA
ncbi:MAG: ferritin-like domain-containing protein [bacterium]